MIRRPPRSTPLYSSAASDVYKRQGHKEEDVGEAAFLSSWHDDTPEGRSILTLAHEKGFVPNELNSLALSEATPFSASTRTSGVKITHLGMTLPKGDKSGHDRLR